MTEGIVFMHHMGIEIMGKEYAPEGFVEHAALALVVSVILFLAGYGLTRLVRDFLGRKMLGEVRQGKRSLSQGM